MTPPSPTLQPSAAPASFPQKNVQPAVIAARTSHIPVPALNPVGANPRLAILAKPDLSSVVPWLLITIKERMLSSGDLHVGFMTTTPATEISRFEQVHRICDFSYPNDPDPSPLTLESRFRATLEPLLDAINICFSLDRERRHPLQVCSCMCEPTCRYSGATSFQDQYLEHVGYREMRRHSCIEKLVPHTNAIPLTRITLVPQRAEITCSPRLQYPNKSTVTYMHNSSSSTCFKASFPIYITRCTQPAGYQSRRIQDQGYFQIAPPNFYAVQRKTPWLTKIAHLVLLLQECGGRQTRPIDCRRRPCARTRPKETNEAEARRAACICRHASV
jgi:hypothetical protein